MIERFKTGRYYKYSGNGQRCGWTSDGTMNFVLDHKPYRCLNGDGYNAKFDKSGYWNWNDGIENWIELAEDNIYKEE
jgi:hypothetical protein